MHKYDKQTAMWPGLKNVALGTLQVLHLTNTLFVYTVCEGSRTYTIWLGSWLSDR